MSDEEVDAGFRGLFAKLAGDVRLLLLHHMMVTSSQQPGVRRCDVFPVVFQDMQISAVELRTILNKIVGKRELAL